MFYPNFIFSDKGVSSCKSKSYRIKNLIYVNVSEVPAEVCITGTIGGKLSFVGKRFNPYKELSYGGITLGFRGKNYWFSDKEIVGKIIALIHRMLS